MHTPTSAEDELVLLAVAPPGAVAEPVPRDGALDWERVLSVAERHRLLGQLASLPLEAPAWVHARLAAWGRQAAAQALSAEEDLEQVARVLRDEGLTPILLKGPGLAHALYPEAPAARAYGDLDLLIRPAELARAHRRLTAAGYRCASGLPEALLERYAQVGEELAYEHPERLTVDLHWRLHDRSLGGDALVAALRLHARRRHGLPLETPAPVETLVYLAIHGAKHGWSHLFWLADLARAVTRPELDWEQVAGLTAACGAQRSLDLGRLLLRELAGVEAGPDVAPDAITCELAGRLAARPLDEAREQGFAERLRYQLALRRSHPERLRLLWGMLATPTAYEWQRWRLPARAFRLYLIPRALRLAQKHLLHGGRDQSPAAGHTRSC